jgi:hypothetical protein
MSDDLYTSHDNQRIIRATTGNATEINCNGVVHDMVVNVPKFDCYFFWSSSAALPSVGKILCRPNTYGKVIAIRCAQSDMDLNGSTSTPVTLDSRDNFFYFEPGPNPEEIPSHQAVFDDFKRAIADPTAKIYYSNKSACRLYQIIMKSELFEDLDSFTFYNGVFVDGRVKGGGAVDSWDDDTHDAYNNWVDSELNLAILNESLTHEESG